MSKIRQPRKKRSVIVVVLALVVSIWGAFQAYYQTRDWGISQIQQQSSERLLDTISNLRTAIDQYRYLPFLLSQNRDVKELLLSPDDNRFIRVSRYLEQTNLIAGSAALMVLDKQGKPVAYSNWREQDTITQLRFDQSPFFTQAISGDEGRSFAFEGTPKRPSYYLSAPIYHQQALIGVSVMRLDVAQLREQLSSETLFFVANQDHQLLFVSTALQSTFSDFWPLEPLKTTKIRDGRVINEWHSAQGSMLVVSVLLDDLKWHVGVLTPLKPATQRALYVAFTLAGGCLALALLVLYLREYRLKRKSQLEVIRAQRESEQRQRYIINTAQVGLITVDHRGRIIFINPMVMQQFGVSLSLIINQPLQMLFADIEMFEPLKRWLDGLSRGEFTPITGYEVVGQRSDGSTFPLLFSIRLMKTAPEASYLVTIIDITRRKGLEYALREANESLERKVIERTSALAMAQNDLVQAEKLAALGRMSTAIVHELNQPLTAMRTYLSILRQLVTQPNLLLENISELNGLVDRMALITGQLKTFAYKKSDMPSRMEFVSAMQRVLQQFEPRFQEQNIALNVSCSESEIFVQADDVRIEQVLINLVKNACDAMLETDVSKLLILDVSVKNGSLSLSISDTGVGASDEQLSHIFEPFYTTKPMGSGLGLGLPIVKSIIQDLKGRIEVKHNTPCGLCFSVSLPVLEVINEE
jgi:PAS domain S-box-containing protein